MKLKLKYKIGDLICYASDKKDIGVIKKVLEDRKGNNFTNYEVYWFSDGETIDHFESDLGDVDEIQTRI